MYDNPLSGRIANSIVQLMVISGNYRWLLGLRPRPHQGGCSSPLDPRLLPGSMLRIDMAWPPGKYRFQRPLLKSSSGSKGCCGTGFRTLLSGAQSSTPKACLRDGGNKAKCQLPMQCTTVCWPFIQNATQHCKDVARCCLLVYYMLTDRRLARAPFRDSWLSCMRHI